jgi:hypothetical protein
MVKESGLLVREPLSVKFEAVQRKRPTRHRIVDKRTFLSVILWETVVS